MKWHLRNTRRDVPPGPLARPIPDYQSRVDAQSEQQVRERPWYEPDLSWRTNRRTLLEFAWSFTGELIATVIGMAMLLFLWSWL